METRIKKLVSDIEKLIKLHLHIAFAMMKAEGGAIYLTDLFFISLLNLSYNLSIEILRFAKEKNILVAAPLLRMQIENLLKTYYLSHLKEKERDKIIIELLKGKRFDEIKDNNNKRLTNARLLKYISEKWLTKAYEDTCKFIHFSERHFFIHTKSIADAPNAFVTETILRKGTPEWPERDLKIFLELQKKITSEILRYANSWVEAKNSVDKSS
ncbi:MAG: hypothetical protein J7K37_05910 [Candidatus Omnitrophica bacterium]|nr:hypothetical protein [Candidatus Omnitrophota bacterium]